MKKNYFNVVKYQATLNDQGKVSGVKWLGPRGKGLSGVDKQLARLAWDRKRFQ
jgi:hypothetical protein